MLKRQDWGVSGGRMRRQGRREQHTIRMRAVTCTFLPEWVDTLDAVANERSISRQELVREIVGTWIKEQTVMPPEPEEHAQAGR